MITRRDFIKITAVSGALVSIGKTSDANATVQAVLPNTDYALESKRKIPVIADVDIVVVGGSSRTIAAAVAASRVGCKVYLIAYMPYLGDDICGSFLYERSADEKLETALSLKIFSGNDYPTPLHVKTVLEDELIDNQVDFLYSSYVTNALVDSEEKIGGVIINNRSGRQAIRCKAIIDGTHTASVAKLFGAELQGDQSEMQTFQYTVVGNEEKKAPEISKVELLPLPLKFNGKTYPITRYTFNLPLKDNSYASLMGIEQTVRAITWDANQVDSSDLLWYIPQQSIRCDLSYKGDTVSIRKLPEQSFKPKGINNLWVLGPCADLPRMVASNVMRPIPALFLGEILGEQIANQIKSVEMPQSVMVRPTKAKGFDYGYVGELLQALRSTQQKGYIDSPRGALPVLGSYDVIVVGGGTAGAVAGISAARHGAKTLVLEYLHGLGGLTTLGLIGRYWDGFRGGFSAVIDKSVRDIAPEDHPRQLEKWEEETLSDWKMEWYRRELLKAKGELWFGVLGCGALVEDNQVKGIVVSTPMGRGVILSKVLIDSTGSADIAIAAGASFDYTGKTTLAVQGAGVGKMDPGDFYCNNDWLFVDDTDILDVSRAYVQAKSKLKGRYDMVKLPQTRERRRVIGEHIISVYDVLNHRRYPDTISYHKSSFDTHGMIVDPYFILTPPMERHTVYDADVPLRSLLPKGLEGILTTGLGTSAHRDAMPVIRMQPCLQNQGYAVGYLSAMAIKEGKSLREIDIKKVQKHLVGIGNLPERVFSDKEFKGFSNKEMQVAAKQVTDNYKGLEILLTDKERCLKLMHKCMNQATTIDNKVVYASIMCILGESTYASVLADTIQQHAVWDNGWHYTGMHQFGMSTSRLDALIIALGNAKVLSTLPSILEKAIQLDPESFFSHFRAIAMSTETINSRDAIPVLADMLTAPGVRFHALNSYTVARSNTVPGLEDVTTRNKALKELHIARALYLCGDKDKLAETVLQQYANGLEGHYARYANEILNLNS